MNRSLHFAAAALAAAAVAGGAGGGVAQASEITLEGRTLVFRGLPAERNAVSVDRSERGSILLTDLGARIVIRHHVCQVNEDRRQADVRCQSSMADSVRVELGDGDDMFSNRGGTPVTVDAGAGDDIFTGHAVRVHSGTIDSAPSQADFSGGPGRDTAHFRNVTSDRTSEPGVSVTKDGVANDGRPIDRNNIRADVEVLEGSPQGDFLSGGPGPDAFVSGRGADTYHGLAGDDLFLMGAQRDGATRARGGGDRDTVSYAQRTRTVFVSPDDPAFRDGEPGEEDSIDGIEVVEGGSGADNLVSAPAASTGYRMIGNAGDDILSSGAGRDRLIGGPGADRMASGAERDVIEARDGAADTSIDCGSNGSDEVFLDFREPRTAGCEIRRLPETFVGAVRLVRSAQPGSGGALRATLSWTHPRSWRKLRAIEVRVPGGSLRLRPRSGQAVARGRGVRLAPGARIVHRGRKVTARLELRRPAAGDRLQVEVAAVDTSGRRQVERRSIAP